MPKDATKNIDRYKIRGGQLNEFEYAQGQKALAEKKPKGDAKLIPGTPPEQAMEGLRPGVAKKTSKATKGTEGRATKGTKSTKATKGKTTKKAANKTTKKAAKKTSKKANSSTQGATAKKLAARKTAARKK